MPCVKSEMLDPRGVADAVTPAAVLAAAAAAEEALPFPTGPAIGSSGFSGFDADDPCAPSLIHDLVLLARSQLRMLTVWGHGPCQPTSCLLCWMAPGPPGDAPCDHGVVPQAAGPRASAHCAGRRYAWARRLRNIPDKVLPQQPAARSAPTHHTGRMRGPS